MTTREEVLEDIHAEKLSLDAGGENSGNEIEAWNRYFNNLTAYLPGKGAWRRPPEGHPHLNRSSGNSKNNTLGEFLSDIDSALAQEGLETTLIQRMSEFDAVSSQYTELDFEHMHDTKDPPKEVRDRMQTLKVEAWGLRSGIFKLVLPAYVRLLEMGYTQTDLTS